MEDSSEVFDELLRKFEPHVRSHFVPRKVSAEEDKKTEELFQFFALPYTLCLLLEKVSILHWIFVKLPVWFKTRGKPSFRMATWEDLDACSKLVCLDLVVASWSETLYFASKGCKGVHLRDCLLPENLGRAERSWDMNISRLGFNREQIENLLRDFAKVELEKGIQLPWGGFVTQDADGPVLLIP